MAFTTLSDVNDDVRYRTNTNAVSVTNADLLRIANKRFKEIVRQLIDLDQDFYTEIQAYNLTAGTRAYTLDADASTSPFGGGVVKILRVEAQLDGTNWRVLKPLGVRQIQTPTQTEADITGQFDNTNPYYAYYNRQLRIYSGSISTVTNGLQVFQVIRPVEMTATSDVPNLPSDFLDILSLGMSVDIYEKYGRTREKNDTFTLYSARLAEMKVQESDNMKEGKPILRAASRNDK